MISPGRHVRAARLFLLLAFAATLTAMAPSPRSCESGEARQALTHFFEALARHEEDKRTSVNILYLGDSHIAGDGIASQLRAHFSTRFGKTSPSLFMPGLAHPHYRIDGLEIAMRGEWAVASARKEDVSGPFGLSGFRLESGTKDGEISIAIKDAQTLSAVDVWISGNKGASSLEVYVDDTWRASFGAKSQDFKHVHLPFAIADMPNRSIRLKPKSGETISLLSAVLTFESPGIRLAALGMPGAQIDVLNKFDDQVVASEIAVFAPDLIILGFGTNEAFDDQLSKDAYRTRLEKGIDWLKARAPAADIVVLGVPDAARLPDFAPKTETPARCAPLTSQESKNYEARLKDQDGELARWHAPPNLAMVRDVQSEIAAQKGVFYIDLGAVMGGACAMQGWVNDDPPKAWPDHVHFKPPGQALLAQKIFAELMAGYDSHQCKNGGKPGNSH